MRLHDLKALEVGDEVDWLDPDDNLCTGRYRIIEIVSDSGRIEDHDSTVVLSGGDGHCTEAMACELA